MKLKESIIDKYYDLLIFLEDFFSGIETIINNHRRRVEERYEE